MQTTPRNQLTSLLQKCTALKTTLTLHQHPKSSHYDWLLFDPLHQDSTHPCKTFRLLYPSTTWQDHTKLCLQEIQYHRDHYLTYQGPVSNNRGYVTPVDAGSFDILTWSSNQIKINLTLFHFQGSLTLTPSQNPAADPKFPLWIATLQKSIKNS